MAERADLAERKDPAPTGICRCEATIAASILDGYACGRADCWRTAEVQASFAAFVEALVTKRGGASEPEPEG